MINQDKISHGILFRTVNCHKCKPFLLAAKTMLPGVMLAEFDEGHRDFPSLCERFEVTTAPTLLLFDQNSEVLHRFQDESELVAAFLPEHRERED